MLSNLLNFSGGPGALPPSVLDQTQRAIIALPDTGISILGMSHRSDWFRRLLQEAQDNIRSFLDIPERFHILFLQGGSSLQFSMIPMNFAAGTKAAAEFVASGYWSRKAIREAEA
ncbi:MAG: aminotransferase class V-fold PLP-dependent enzyme, partial [Rhodanobacter sp.]